MSDSELELDLLVGAIVAGKYRVDELIGRGGMGGVYRATNTAIGKRVALKFLYREAAFDRDAVARFQREAEAASAVESAHIVEIFDSGNTDDGRPFLVMELLRGEDLRHRLAREGRLPPRDAVRIAAQVARALRRAHEAGIVHRDLKPDNVFLCERDDDPMFVKIVDFGISKVFHREGNANALTRRGVVLGTAFYMSPEQAQAVPDVDGRTDLFSVGAILYEAITGQPPHTGVTYESVLIDICTKDAPPIRDLSPEVSAPLAQVVHRALARDRARRFQTASELYSALVAADPSITATGGELRSHEFELGVATPGLTPGGASARTTNGAVLRGEVSAEGRRRRRRAFAFAALGLVGALSATVLLLASGARTRSAVDPPPDPAPSAVTGIETASRPVGSPPAEVNERHPEPAATGAGAGSAPLVSPASAAPPNAPVAPMPTAGAKPSTTRGGGRLVPLPKTTGSNRPVARAGVAGELELATEP
ncbi:MAG: serine/threonine protein kinase [Polyangiaceae bacterium]|nr:serine/threonine protein kinase [Polyangiaceae bacterium]